MYACYSRLDRFIRQMNRMLNHTLSPVEWLRAAIASVACTEHGHPLGLLLHSCERGAAGDFYARPGRTCKEQRHCQEFTKD